MAKLPRRKKQQPIYVHASPRAVSTGFQAKDLTPWIALVLSAVALFLNFRSSERGEQTSESRVRQSLNSRATQINEGFVRHKIKSPFAHKLNIPEEKHHEFTAKAVLLLHQVNMLKEVHDNKEVLGNATVESYSKWAKNMVYPWIQADADLSRAYELQRQEKDLTEPDFHKWLEQLMPIPVSPPHPPVANP